MQAQGATGEVLLPNNRLRELRERRDLKLYDISALVRVDPATVSRWETGASAIPDETKIRLAKFFDVPISYLLAWDQIDGVAA